MSEDREKYRIEPLDVKVPKSIPLSSAEQAAIKALEKLARTWPKTLMLFLSAGSLEVVRSRGGEILATIHGIPNDGGDPGSYVDEKTGREFINLE